MASRLSFYIVYACNEGFVTSNGISCDICSPKQISINNTKYPALCKSQLSVGNVTCTLLDFLPGRDRCKSHFFSDISSFFNQQCDTCLTKAGNPN